MIIKILQRDNHGSRIWFTVRKWFELILRKIILSGFSTGKMDSSEQVRFSSLSCLDAGIFLPSALSKVFDNDNRFRSRFFFFRCQPVRGLNLVHDQACHDTNPCKAESEISLSINKTDSKKNRNSQFETILG